MTLSLHALMQPWIATLLQMKIRPVKTKERSMASVVWINWNWPTHHHTRCLEAIELFVLFAIADPTAWRGFVEELRTASSPWFAYQWTSIVLELEPQPIVAGIDLVCTTLPDVLQLCTYLTDAPSADDPLSDDYKRVRQILQAKVDGDATVPVRLRLKPGRPWRANVLDVLPTITNLCALQAQIKMDLHTANQQVDASSRLASHRMRIVALHNDIADFTRVDEAYLREMMEIYRHGIRVADLPVLQMENSSQSSTTLVEALVFLLGTRRLVEEPGSVQCVTISRLHEPTIARAVLSAIAFSDSVREISVDFQHLIDASAATQRRAMHWLAFALFSPHVSHCTTTTHMNCESLTSDHVRWMRELLTADDPLTVLFDDELSSSSDIEEYQNTRLSSSRLHLVDPTALKGFDYKGEPVEITTFDSLQVIDKTQDWYSVLLPGWGRAWVHDRDVTRTSSIATLPSSSAYVSKIRPIQRLELTRIQGDTNLPALELLQLIGHAVQELDLLDRNESLDEWCCPNVLAACPNLRDLHMWQATSENLVGFAESLAAGHCTRLERLSLGVEMLSQDALDQDLGMLLQVLADPAHRMAQQLQTFEFDVFCMVDGHDVVDSTILTQTLGMLEKNTSLSFFKLHLPLSTRTPEQIPGLKTAFEKHHDVFLPAPRKPMGVREKLAFLSVVWGYRDIRASLFPATARLDTSVLTTIFEFVPDRRRRLVDVAMPRAAEDDDDA